MSCQGRAIVPGDIHTQDPGKPHSGNSTSSPQRFRTLRIPQNLFSHQKVVLLEGNQGGCTRTL